jgi:glucosamine-6-phosphate deaminase
MTSESNLTARMKVFKDYEALSLFAAEEVAALLKANPNACLALPSGRSPARCYQILAQWSEEGQISWVNAKCFALDEYYDVEKKFSFQQFLESSLYSFTDLPQSARFSPLQADGYDQLIADHGGLDFCILGIGENGHIAFNEPPTPRQSWTHCVWLSEETRSANRKYFAEAVSVPRRAITMGISTLLASRKVLLIASGKNKREALLRALREKPDENLPASFLTTHPNLLVIADFAW